MKPGILDFTTPEVWPEWRNYRDEAYFTAIPKLQDIIINPPPEPCLGYVRLELVVQGKAIYLRAPSPHDPVMIAAGAALLAAIGLAGSLVPGWRAARLDPAHALRAD